jgi:hypothetical protein
MMGGASAAAIEGDATMVAAAAMDALLINILRDTEGIASAEWPDGLIVSGVVGAVMEEGISGGTARVRPERETLSAPELVSSPRVDELVSSSAKPRRASVASHGDVLSTRVSAGASAAHLSCFMGNSMVMLSVFGFLGPLPVADRQPGARNQPRDWRRRF